MWCSNLKVLLIVVDTLRADHLGCYGYFRETSPNIDRLAEEGVLFEDFFASGVATGPGFTSIFTGLYPINSEYYITPWNVPNAYPLDDNIIMMAEVFLENGYTTAAFDNLVNFRSHMKHFIRGYQYHINMTGTAKWLHHHIMADQINTQLLPWLKVHIEEDFFLFVHYWDPHMPYNQPQEYREMFHHEKGNLSDLYVEEAPAGYSYVPGWGRTDRIYEGSEVLGEDFGDQTLAPTQEKSIDLYDGEIRYVDDRIEQVIRVLRGKDVLDDTLIVLTSDHGECLGEHGTYGHSGVYDSTTFLPLIMRFPSKLPSGKKISGFCQHVDIAYTLFQFADIPVEDTISKMKSFARKTSRGDNELRGFTDGNSLTNLVKEEKIRENVYLETWGQRAIRTEKWKLIKNFKNERVELYNLEEDPMETIDLRQKESKTAQTLERRLMEWMRKELEGRKDPIRRSPTWIPPQPTAYDKL